MNTEPTTIDFDCPTEADTRALADRLGKLLHGGEVIELASDLGGGKTSFTQGLAMSLGYKGPVTSPTFTLSQIYQIPDGPEIHHYDLYRLEESGVVGTELAEDLDDKDIIVVVEWGDLVAGILPKDRLRIEFEVTSENGRILHATALGPVSEKLLVGLSK